MTKDELKAQITELRAVLMGLLATAPLVTEWEGQTQRDHYVEARMDAWAVLERTKERDK
jgi:hypothetical protein